MTKSSKTCQSLRFTAKALKLLALILHLCTLEKPNLYLIGLARYQGGIGGKVGVQRRKCQFFQGFRREYIEVLPK